MALALLGYFSTMVAALAGFMLLLSSVLTSSYMDKARLYPRPRVELGQTVATAPVTGAANTQVQAANVEVPDAALTKPAADKSKHLKVARTPTRRDTIQRDALARREDSAGRHQDQEYSMTLGYAGEVQRQAAAAPLFDFLQPRRF